tara:strand:+ start:1250 stop:3835 length:2586 start_codon:yes stop_codon:yes gene_type:complete
MSEPIRKLAAIVFTDIVGFTELSSKNEPLALELIDNQRKYFKPIVQSYNGQWLKEIGDGLLLTFNGTLDAVKCCIEIQGVAKSIDHLDIRIGIHQGEVLYKDGDVFGDDVNIASRVEPFAGSGGIAISGRVNTVLERDPGFETYFLGEPALKGVFQNVKIYSIISQNLPKGDKIIDDNAKTNIQFKDRILSKKSLFILSLSFILIFIFSKINSKILLDNGIEEIVEKFDQGDNYFVFQRAKDLLGSFPENKLLNLYFDKATVPINISTDSLLAKVYIKYESDTSWNYVGETPIDSLKVPASTKRHKAAKDFQLKFIINERSILAATNQSGHFYFGKVDDFPDDHSIISGLKDHLMYFPGIDFGGITFEPFSISRTEVSNLDFKDFVDNGGYENENYWDFPVIIDSKEYTYDMVIKSFVDKHGKPGPSNWSYGQFAANRENFPVTGISWFEARAYARYKKLALPNVFQWLSGAGLSGFVENLPDISNSNLKANYLWEVNDSRGGNYYGIKNIAGNVREWATNPKGVEKINYSILGGSYLDNPYSFNEYQSVSPFDRSLSNGFRLVKSKNDKSLDNFTITYNQRNILSEPDVSDEVFNIYKKQFEYENYDLDETLELISGHDGYVVQRYELTPPYISDELLHGYIVYSKKIDGLIIPIIEFPIAAAIYRGSDESIVESIIANQKHLLMEGYAIIRPVYSSTYSRKKTINSWWANETDQYKNTVIKMGKDYKRSIDYIESRDDFDFKNLSYMGYSWGSIMGNIMLAIDDRVKFAFLLAGGLEVQKTKQEIDPAIYTRRITMPVMHINGKNDGVFDYNNSQLPMQKLLGTPEEDQEMIVLEGVGHIIPEDIIIENHLKWLKRYIK